MRYEREWTDAGGKFAFIDTRNPQAWEASDVKLPGAIRLRAENLEQRISELPKNRPIVTYCT